MASSLDTDTLNRLIAAAIQAKSYSYSPYSRFRVGCALLDSTGRIWIGCNVENCSYGAAICAERVAYTKAISEGQRTFQACMITSDQQEEFIVPCGVCRQFMAEFGLDTRVLMLRGKDEVQEIGLEELLPRAFTPASLHK